MDKPDQLLEDVARCLQGWSMRHDIKPELSTAMIQKLCDVDQAKRLYESQLTAANERVAELERQLAEAGKAWHERWQIWQEGDPTDMTNFKPETQ